MSDNSNININTPEIGPYTQLRPFRFWCQKVLPLVYDESLSYYELLCKVVDYLNKTMEDVDQMIVDMGEFKAADTEFKTEVRDAYIAFSREVSQAIEGLETFVNNYFNNLNVQTEINNKLDAMAAAGYFDTLFTTLFTDDIITETGAVTTAWIAENLLQETGYVIDKSLTVENAAADAKTTGDFIRTINTVLNIVPDLKVTKNVNNETVTMVNPIDLHIGDTLTWSIPSAIALPIYGYVYNADDTRYTSRYLPAGDTSVSVTLTDEVTGGYVTTYTTAENVPVTFTVTPAEREKNEIELLQDEIDDINDKIVDIATTPLLYPSNTVRTIGHRGNPIDAPQNTAPAYILARQAGITVMENDIDITDDSYFVMWHDGYLHALGDMVDLNGYLMYTDGTDYYWYNTQNEKLYTYENGEYVESETPLASLTRCNGNNYAVRSGYTYGGNPCTALPFDILRRVDFGAYKAEKFKGTQILTFAEWVILCKKLGCEIYVDAKLTYTEELVTRAANIVKNLGMSDKASWLGMSTANWGTLRNIIEDARVGVLGNPSADAVISYAPYNIGRGMFFDGNANSLTEELTHIGLAAGFEVECYYVGYSVDDKEAVFERINELISYGIRGITCDKYTIEDVTNELLFSYNA